MSESSKPLIVKYVGPHRGGLQQVGTLEITIAWGEWVELPADIAGALLDQAPDHWQKQKGGAKRRADAPPKKTETVATPAAAVEPEEGTTS